MVSKRTVTITLIDPYATLLKTIKDTFEQMDGKVICSNCGHPLRVRLKKVKSGFRTVKMVYEFKHEGGGCTTRTTLEVKLTIKRLGIV